MLIEMVSLDYGIVYYFYYGGDDLSDGNYLEVYIKFGYVSDYGSLELNFWYMWDYFGIGVKYVIVMVVYIFELVFNYYLCVSFDVFNLLDSDKWLWNGDDIFFYYYCLVY